MGDGPDPPRFRTKNVFDLPKKGAHKTREMRGRRLPHCVRKRQDEFQQSAVEKQVEGFVYINPPRTGNVGAATVRYITYRRP